MFQNVSLQLGITYWFHQLTSDLSDLESADVLDVMNQKFCGLLRVNVFIWTQPVLMTVVYNMERGQHMNSGQFVGSGLKFWGICIVFCTKQCKFSEMLPSCQDYTKGEVKVYISLGLHSSFFAVERRGCIIIYLDSFSVFQMV